MFHVEVAKNSLNTRFASLDSLSILNDAIHASCRWTLREMQGHIVGQVSKMVDNCLDLINSTLHNLENPMVL